MDKMINHFLRIYEEEFDRNSGILKDLRFIEATVQNEDSLQKAITIMSELIGEIKAEMLAEEISDTFNHLTRIRDEYMFKHAFLLGVNLGIEVQNKKEEYAISK